MAKHNVKLGNVSRNYQSNIPNICNNVLSLPTHQGLSTPSNLNRPKSGLLSKGKIMTWQPPDTDSDFKLKGVNQKILGSKGNNKEKDEVFKVLNLPNKITNLEGQLYQTLLIINVQGTKLQSLEQIWINCTQLEFLNANKNLLKSILPSIPSDLSN